MFNIKKKIETLLKKIVFSVLFFLITFFAFNLNSRAAYFNYSDFDFDEFAEENKNYWTGNCVNEKTADDQEKCIEIILSNQRIYYTRLYQLLAKYEKKGYKIDDNILIATTFFELTPDLFSDNSEKYKKLYQSDSSPYNYDENLDLNNYDIDAEPDPDYFINEKDTLDLLIKNMFGYVSKCYGIYGEVVETINEDGTTAHSCPSGGNPSNVDGEYICASTADSDVVGFWEYIAKKSGFNWFFGLKNNQEEHCNALSSSYLNGTKYVMEDKKQYSPDTIKKYWEFLETSEYFDNKAHLSHHYQSILIKTNHLSMKELSNTEKEEYAEDLITIRKRIVRNIKSILEVQGTKVENPNLYSINNTKYWWPIGGDSITADSSGKQYAMGTPTNLTVSSAFGYRQHPTTGEENTFHYGIDIAGPEGAHIIAARAGIVETVVSECISGGAHDCGGGFGNYVVLSHGDGNYTVYAHLLEGTITVSVGQSVNQGEILGQMGSSGRSTGPHLHFELRVGGNSASNSVDPLTYISVENPRPTLYSTSLVEGENNQQTLCQTLLASGYSTNGTIALMVNASAESSFNPVIDGDQGTSYGLFQWHDTRKSNLINMFPNSYSNIDSQVSFLNYELENGYYQLHNTLKTGSDSGDKLAYEFCVQFERPAGGSTTCKKRTETYIDEMKNYVMNQCR